MKLTTGFRCVPVWARGIDPVAFSRSPNSCFSGRLFNFKSMFIWCVEVLRLLLQDQRSDPATDDNGHSQVLPAVGQLIVRLLLSDPRIESRCRRLITDRFITACEPVGYVQLLYLIRVNPFARQ
jgi:hypothetical protein